MKIKSVIILNIFFTVLMSCSNSNNEKKLSDQNAEPEVQIPLRDNRKSEETRTEIPQKERVEVYDDRLIDKMIDSILTGFDGLSRSDKLEKIAALENLAKHSDGAGSEYLASAIFDLFESDPNLVYDYLSENSQPSNLVAFLAFDICQTVGMDSRYPDRKTMEKRLRSFIKSKKDEAVVNRLLKQIIDADC